MQICASKRKKGPQARAPLYFPHQPHPGISHQRNVALRTMGTILPSQGLRWRNALVFCSRNPEVPVERIAEKIRGSRFEQLTAILDDGVIEDAPRRQLGSQKNYPYDYYYWAINQGRLNISYVSTLATLVRIGYTITLYTTTHKKYEKTILELLDVAGIRKLFSDILYKPKLKADGISWLAEHIKETRLRAFAGNSGDIWPMIPVHNNVEFVVPSHWIDNPRYRAFFNISDTDDDRL